MPLLAWLLALALSIALSVTPVSAAHSSTTPRNERCINAIASAYNFFTFAGLPNRGRWEPGCQNRLHVISIYASAEVYCSDESDRVAGLAALARECQHHGLEFLPRDVLAANLTEEAIMNMRVVDYMEVPRGEVVDQPVLLSSGFFGRILRTQNTWEFEMWAHHAYGYAINFFWMGLILVGSLNHLVKHLLYTNRARRLGRSIPSVLCVPFRALYESVQTHLIVPAPLGAGRKILWCTLPTRIVAIVVAIYWALSILACCVGYRLFSENIYWSEISQQLLRYVADRTGILSFANLSLLWVFGVRNNIFLWATGWSFATFNIFHRHIARVATLQAVVHTIVYTFLMWGRGNIVRKFMKPYLLWGTAAVLAMVLLLPLAFDWLRHKSYEFFLVTHILLSVVALVGCFYHVEIFDDHAYWNYLWPATAFWLLDRVLRLVRLVYCNLRVRFGHGTTIQTTRTIATYNPASDVVRLEVTPGASHLRAGPGQYYFLYQPFRLKGWENHPFTLGAWTYQSTDADEIGGGASRKMTSIIDVAQMPLLSEEATRPHHSPGIESEMETSEGDGITTLLSKETLIFWIRPYDGWTRSLRDQCLASPNRTANPIILLEGVYGDQFPLWEYESVLLVAGGTGIASAVPYIQTHIQNSSNSTKKTATVTRDIRLIWTARQVAFIQDVASRELHTALGRSDFNAQFYSTAQVPIPTEEEEDEEEEEQGGRGDGDNNRNGTATTNTALLHKQFEAEEIMYGRPDLHALVLEHATEARASHASAAVLVCGPVSMADEVRRAVVAAREAGCSVRYVEELFTW
ncbi:hypothetical protein ASPZODRAFT_160065 [Penicilliopsis zonata CBS 506.65]|uniref:FAD-binding FR-type domain-containing protein n=1 Tax=Penicilliopsis zonata CBS 506.65 TaxID=1073090 RepID=A0A1L9SF76_9EURO|nr:hypothetical protein ASPZODRAFT_160065 [Penicilliopsis zonata CBS 506.65]OJJ45856.1 hypothetical protein ASPZODRAFT_160065 [Penicilliopsis zonata CBS 506.65]